jgi:uncharacterized protein (TIGR02246 family)
LRAENEHVIETLQETYKSAVFAKDLEAFIAIYDEDIEVFDTWGARWIYQGLDSWRGMAKEWFGALGDERVQVAMDNVHIKQMQTAAFVSAFLTYTALSTEGRPLRSLQNRMTWVVESKQGLWKIIHEHTSVPVDQATLQAILRR